MSVTATGVRDAGDIERALTAVAREPNGGLIITPSPLTATRRDVIIAAAARLGIPAIYPFRFYANSGGLVSYGIDQLESVRGRRRTSTASCVAPVPASSRCSCRPNMNS